MFEPSRPAFPTWPAVAAALVYGAVEWAALWRSRALDGLLGWRRSWRRR